MTSQSFKLVEYNVDIEYKAKRENAVTDTLSRNPQRCMEMTVEVNVYVQSSFLWRETEQLIQQQKNDSEFRCENRYLEVTDGISSLNAAMFEKWSFKLINAFSFILKLLIHEKIQILNDAF